MTAPTTRKMRTRPRSEVRDFGGPIERAGWRIFVCGFPTVDALAGRGSAPATEPPGIFTAVALGVARSVGTGDNPASDDDGVPTDAGATAPGGAGTDDGALDEPAVTTGGAEVAGGGWMTAGGGWTTVVGGWTTVVGGRTPVVGGGLVVPGRGAVVVVVLRVDVVVGGIVVVDVEGPGGFGLGLADAGLPPAIMIATKPAQKTKATTERTGRP
jgi:hypothetical protein